MCIFQFNFNCFINWIQLQVQKLYLLILPHMVLNYINKQKETWNENQLVLYVKRIVWSTQSFIFFILAGEQSLHRALSMYECMHWSANRND